MPRQYNKPALSTSDQAELLIKRGLTGISKQELEKILNNINYYRLRGYTYCYQNPDSTFKNGSDWKRSRETFKDHYQTNYDTSLNPPAWMIFEPTTFGTVSKYFSNLDSTLTARNEIAQYFGFNKSSAKVFISWLQHLNLVRNICAPDYDFRKKIKQVIHKFRKGQLASMGFPKNWEQEPLFK